MRRSVLVTSLITAAVAAAVPASAPAAPVKVGVADNSPQIFVDPLFHALKPKFTRLIVPIDTIAKGGADLAELDAYIARAEATRMEVLVTFNPTRDHTLRYNTTKDLPSTKQFTAAFKAFRARYPRQRTISAWNEVNHPTQPTFKNPKRAAQFTNIAAKHCRGCKIVAGDFINQHGLRRYFRIFKKNLRIKPKYWGLHNYPDVNRFRPKGTKEFLKLSRKGQVWLTETGGIVALCPRACSFEYDEKRAAKAIDYMFRLTRTNRRITRLYVYSFYGEPRGARFDAGLVGSDGKPRASYCRVKQRTNKQGRC